MKRIALEDAVLWQDQHILVLNKPAGLLSVPDGYNPEVPHLTAAIEPKFGKLWIVHRLDRETSGVILLARDEQAHRFLCRKFEQHQVTKAYHALVMGDPAWDNQTVEYPLRANGDRHHRTVVDYRKGKFSRTYFSVLERFGRWAFVEARPETGRTHQIRVHLKEIGTPIVADSLYGESAGLYLSDVKPSYKKSRNGEEQQLLGRVGLHARAITIELPFDGPAMFFEAPYPKDIALSLRQLRRYNKSNK
jgi:RluA family pseudouridine synthase